MTKIRHVFWYSLLARMLRTDVGQPILQCAFIEEIAPCKRLGDVETSCALHSDYFHQFSEAIGHHKDEAVHFLRYRQHTQEVF